MATDIYQKIENDFGTDSQKVMEEIKFMNAQSKGMIGNRILRAVVYLAKGNFDDFRYFAEKARTEFNEVLRQAEHDENGHKIYDFNKSFYQLKLMDK